MSPDVWPWAALVLLGAVHGINPGMGWLFAVALGLQEGSGRAVWRALLPLAAGYALAIALAVLVAAMLGRVVPVGALKWIVAAALLGVGAWRLVRHRHPRWGGMRVGARDLAIWSFLMATAHGAGLMVLPLTMAADMADGDATAAGGAGAHAHAGHAVHFTGGSDIALAGGGLAEFGVVLATLLHTAGYLLITGVVALVVHQKVGLRFLRSAWINLDVIWAAALVVTAVLTIVT
jgi:hypothetical protein